MKSNVIRLYPTPIQTSPTASEKTIRACHTLADLKVISKRIDAGIGQKNRITQELITLLIQLEQSKA